MDDIAETAATEEQRRDAAALKAAKDKLAAQPEVAGVVYTSSGRVFILERNMLGVPRQATPPEVAHLAPFIMKQLEDDLLAARVALKDCRDQYADETGHPPMDAA